MASTSTRLPAHRRRRQLLDIAHDAFAARGFHNTSMDEIAEAAGVTKPVLYQHWASKRALYHELLEDVGDQLLQALAGSARAATSPRQQVEYGFAGYFGWVAANTSSFRLLFGSGAQRDREFARVVRHVEATIAAFVAEQIHADIDEEHRLQLAYGVVGMAEGVGRSIVSGLEDDRDPPRNGGPAFDAEVLSRRVAQLAWTGLRGIQRD